jgi:NitT/TauT family transport system substrate-binding protein
VIGHHRTRTGKGWFEERLGPGVKVEWSTFNAGPSAMEALVGGAVDVTYVGPSPALNTYVKWGGKEIRVLAAATRGGSALVVQGDRRIAAPADFRGKRVATPQVGNTQDVALRTWLVENGLHVTQGGGDVTVKPTQNPEQLAGFIKGDIDAVWTVEPWVSRLETEGKGKILREDPDALTTILVASAKFVRERPEQARKLIEAHRALTAWIREHGDEARDEVREELRAETRVELSPELTARAWKRMKVDDAIAKAEFETFVKASQAVGFLKDAASLDDLVPDLAAPPR